MRTVGDEVRECGLRARKKALTRQAILASAERLFAQRGYDAVTVAQIADAANVSVKTLFQYFDSKEDLAFADADCLRDVLLTAVRERPADVSMLSAITHALHSLVDSDVGPEGLAGFHCRVGESTAVRSRLRRMWEDYEMALASQLASEEDVAAPTPEMRLVVAQIIAMVRLLSIYEVRDAAGGAADDDVRRAAMNARITDASRLLARGLGTYGVCAPSG